ncbi:hypothetical protein LCGC14_0724180 [marine sediment metagenome]|uniref:Uncharacterized protein n=1 Tax=marine sediment metagenome TaxID=412755 RepID=A0A0F9SWR6_9ZZZZ
MADALHESPSFHLGQLRAAVELYLTDLDTGSMHGTKLSLRLLRQLITGETELAKGRSAPTVSDRRLQDRG